jgi:hypothetical protein
MMLASGISVGTYFSWRSRFRDLPAERKVVSQDNKPGMSPGKGSCAGQHEPLLGTSVTAGRYS